MPDAYVMKDLGYERTPTQARLMVGFSDGTLWAIPVQLIVDERDAYYAAEKEDTAGFISRGSLDGGEIKDWAENNMNWSDVEEFAVQLPASGVSRQHSYEMQWTNAIKEISTSGVIVEE